MDNRQIHIRNMVCGRCIKTVREILKNEGLHAESVTLGEVVLADPASKGTLDNLKIALKAEGFELLDDNHSREISRIKDLLIQLIHYGDLENMDQNISDYLSQHLHKEYKYLSHLFSSSENMTIEQFVIFQKIEKVKELLVYNELSLKEIAFQMGYSSVAHLSSQFKRITGFTTSQFKKLKDHKRIALDKI